MGFSSWLWWLMGVGLVALAGLIKALFYFKARDDSQKKIIHTLKQEMRYAAQANQIRTDSTRLNERDINERLRKQGALRDESL